jgi:hypothetical protein
VSVRVDVGELAERLAEHGFAYLVTVGGDHRAHVVATAPVLDGGRLVIAALGRHSTANATATPDVTLVWPPTAEGGYSLIVDGTATVEGDTARVVPTSAILHRPAAGEPSEPGGCGADCQPIGPAST